MAIHYATFFFPLSRHWLKENLYLSTENSIVYTWPFGGQFFVLYLFQLGKEATTFRPRTAPPLVMGNLSYLLVQLVLILQLPAA